MSEFNMCFSGKGIGKAVQVEQDGKFYNIVAGNSNIDVWNAQIDEDAIYFDIGHNTGCSDYFDFFLYELARALPDTDINYYWHSTMSNSRGSYNIGYYDGHYVEWDDDNVFSTWDYLIKYKGIKDYIKCGRTDAAGFTHVWVNGKEFWLNDMKITDDSLYFKNAEKGKRTHTGIFNEFAKLVPEHKITVNSVNFEVGSLYLEYYTYVDGEVKYEYELIDE